MLHLRRDEERLNLLVRYCRDGKPALTATLRGQISKLTNRSILASLSVYGHWPMRVWVSIHIEALRLFWKKCCYYRRPSRPACLSAMQCQPGNGREMFDNLKLKLQNEALIRLARQIQYGSLKLTLPDGHQIEAEGKHPGPAADLTLHEGKALRAMLRDGKLGFCEAVLDGQGQQ